jgi:hypothetical protein
VPPNGDQRPRLWGRWQAVFDPSGACMVMLEDGDLTKPHLYVFADPLPQDPMRGQANRRVMCRVLASYLTGDGPRPVWLEDFSPHGKSALVALTGAALVATGPWRRSGGAAGPWVQDQTTEARRRRRQLLRAVLSGE